MDSVLEKKCAAAQDLVTSAVMQALDLPEFLVHTWLVGSTYINGVEGADIDVVCYAPGFEVGMEIPHFKCQQIAEGYTGGRMLSFRQADINLIMCLDMEYAKLWKIAADVCKIVAPTTKEVRIAIHRLIMDSK